MWLAAFLIEKNAKYWKNWLLFWNFGIKCCIIWSKLMQIMWFFYNSSIFHLIYQFTKFYFFRKYFLTVKTMNEWMNEWMKKMAVTWVDKNESFFKRTHNTDSDCILFGNGIRLSGVLVYDGKISGNYRSRGCEGIAGSIVASLARRSHDQEVVNWS